MIRRTESEPIDRDERLGEAIEAYLALAESGAAPDPEAFANGYPDLVEELREALDGLALVQGLVGDGRGPGHRLESGRRVAGYRIVRELGRGGMGVVYEAVHVDLDRPVALKVLGTHAAPDSTGRRRFLNEARTAAGLHHTHIVPVFDVGQVGGLCYYAMQRIEGSGLDRVLKSLRRDRSTAAGSGSGRPFSLWHGPEPEPVDPLSGLGDETISWIGGDGASAASRPKAEDASRAEPPGFEPPRGPAYYRWVAQVGRQAAEALAHAHRRGVIHRDVKPSNLLVDARGTVWVADFGLARRLADPALTHTDSLLGTPRYMSPEQAQTGPIDGRTDVYSLGATLFELLTLRPPFDGRTAAELVQQIGGRDPLAPRRLDPRIPRDLETIVLKAMAKRPADRYAGAAELAEDLARFLGHEPVKARRIGPIGRAWRFAQRHPSLAAVSTVATVAILATAGIFHAKVLAERNEARRFSIEKGKALEKLEEAHRKTQSALVQQLWRESSLIRYSHVPDRRKKGLGRIKEAVALGPDRAMRARLRDEAVEFLALRDVEARPPLPTGPTSGLAFIGDGERLATLAEDGSEFALFDGRGERLKQQSLAGRQDEGDRPMGPRPPGGRRAGPAMVAVGASLAILRPDGRGVRLFDAATGARTAEIEMPGRQVVALAATPSGHRLVIVERTETPPADPDAGPGPKFGFRISLWDPTRGAEPLAELTDSPADLAVWTHPLLAVAPDGRTIATAWSTESDVALWDADDGRSRGTIPTRADVMALAFGPEGLLAVASGGTVQLWDATGGNALPGLSQPQAYVRFLRFSPDGSLLAVVGSSAGIELWDPAANTLVAVLPAPERLHDLAFSPDGRRLVAAGATTSAWAVVDPVGRVRFSGFEFPIRSLAFGPEDQLVMASWEDDPRIWRAGCCPSTARPFPAARAAALAFDDRGRLAAITPDAIQWFQPPDPKPLERLALPEPIGSNARRAPGSATARTTYFAHPIARSPDGRTLAMFRNHEVLTWRRAEPTSIRRLPPPSRGRGRNGDGPGRNAGPGRGPGWRPPPVFVALAVAPAGDRLYLLNFDGSLFVAELDGSAPRRLPWDVPEGLSSLALSPDGRTLALGDRRGAVTLLDTARGAVRASLPPDSAAANPIRALAFAPDSRTLAVGNQAGAIQLWALDAHAEPLVRLPGHRGPVTILTFDPGGRMLASAGDDKAVEAWDLDRVRQQLNTLGLAW